MTPQRNNLILAVAIGLLAVGVMQMLPAVDFPDLPDITPADEPGPLGKLVEPQHRSAFAQLFTDMATIVESDTAGVIDSTDTLRRTQQAASRLLVQAGSLPVNATLRAELERRQSDRFGVESRPIDAGLRAEIAAFYRQVAGDF